MLSRTRIAAGLALASVAVPLAPAAVPTLAAPAAAAEATVYIANNPRPNASSPVCSAADQGACSLTNGMLALIDSASCQTGEIRALWYSLGNPRVREALVEKAKCGTKVWLATSRQKPDGEGEGAEPDGEMELALAQVKAAGGKTMLGWGALARGGAHGKKYAQGKDSAGLEHEKLLLVFDGHGGWWVLSDSGNGTYSGDTDWNDRAKINDRCLYKAAVIHFGLVWRDRYIAKEKPAATCDGRRQLWWMPTSHVDPVLARLRKTTCGKGDVVTVSPFYYAGGKATDYTDELRRFAKAGASVNVARNASWQHWSDYQAGRLAAGGVRVIMVQTWVGVDANGKPRLKYDHRKAGSLEGCSGGPFMWQGSATTTSTAYEKNGNQVLTSSVAADAAAARLAFVTMTKVKL